MLLSFPANFRRNIKSAGIADCRHSGDSRAHAGPPQVFGKVELGRVGTAAASIDFSEDALALFEGGADAAMRWLTSSQKTLGDQTPLEHARTEIGAREVEERVGRLEHGVFS
jgi:hypothetical protein